MDAIPALDGISVEDPEEQIGIDIIKRALTAPVATIAANAGYEGSVVVDKIKNLPAGEGLNSANGEWGNMIDMGVLDPVKVTRTTLQNAASVASLILITEADRLRRAEEHLHRGRHHRGCRGRRPGWHVQQLGFTP